MKRILLTLILTIVAAPAWAQRLNLDFGNLADKASESVDVTLDGPMLKLALGFLNMNDPEERAARDMVKKLEGIYVKSFQFDADGAYDRSIVARVRSQLGPSWKKIVGVQSRTKENVEIYTDMRGEAIAGLVIISAEPRELTVVNIVGPIDIERLAELEGNFGIPHVTSKDKEK
jgi:uncharacterized protein DUF4252